MRRPTHRPRHFHAHHDEYVPSLSVLRRWNSTPSLPICVDEIDGKGLSVVARRQLAAGTVVARYEFRVVLRSRAPPGDYRVDVNRQCVGKLDARSFGPPEDGVAQVGALLNEPTHSIGENANCERLESEYFGPASHRRGAFLLRTTRAVSVGEELTWDYGAGYGRREYQ